MNTLPAIIMLFLMVCAASCILIDKCRTLPNVICAVIMVWAMFDVMYLHLVSPSLLAVLLVATGVWAAFSLQSGNNLQYDFVLRMHRLFSTIVMAWLLLRHNTAMAAVHDHHHQHTTSNFLSLPSTVSLLLLITGLALSIVLIISLRQTQQAKSTQQLVAFEPTLMGLSLVLMAI